MKTIGVSGQVRPNSGVGVIQRCLYPRLSRLATVKESATRDMPGRFGAVIGLMRGLLPPPRTEGGYLCTVSPLPFRAPKPLIYIVHDLRWLREGSALKRAYRRWDLGRAVAQATMLICVSDTTRRELIEHFPAAEATSRAVWLGPGVVDEDAWAEGEPGRLLLVGGAARKRNELAARVVEHLPPGTVTSATGIGISEEAARILREHLGEENVTLHGRVDDEEMRRAFAEAFYYVHLGTDEGFGLPFVEALKSGTVVVAVDQPLTREVLGEAAVLVPPVLEAKAIAAAWANAEIPKADERRHWAAQFSWDELEDAVASGLALTPSKPTRS